MRADRVAIAFLNGAAPHEIERFLAGNPRLAQAASALTATGDNPTAGQWIVRVVLSLLFWPAGDYATERALVERFVVPVFTPA
ncbi:hypothetical protein [Nocardia xishanensis]|uniref:hypothetical protein n=1 Tax=Nocardia xishanensis TaxID=238964 RepID=UPI00082D57E4|nr:hypothetical protein [Nocardia xishanensis]